MVFDKEDNLCCPSKLTLRKAMGQSIDKKIIDGAIRYGFL
jgi:hypothetical protein